MPLNEEAERWIARAIAELAAHDPSSAEQFLRKAAAADPDSFLPRAHLAYFCYKQKRYVEALRFYAAAIRRRPLWIQAYLRIVLCLLRGSGSRVRRRLLRSAAGRRVLWFWYFPLRALVWTLLVLAERLPLPADRERSALRAGPFRLSRILREYLTGSVESGILSPIYARCTEFPLVLNRLAVEPGLRVLEVACGWTPLPRILRKNGCRVVGIDKEFPVLRRTRNDPWNRDARDAYIRADAARLPFPDDSFDRVFSISAIEHFPAEIEEAAMREIGRVLRPGGIAVITAGSGAEEREISYDVDGVPQMFRTYTPDAVMRRLVRPSGLEPADVIFFGECSPIGWHLITHTDSFFRPTQLLTPLLAYLRTRRISGDALGGAYWSIPCVVLRKPAP